MPDKQKENRKDIISLIIAFILVIALCAIFVIAYSRVYNNTETELLESAEDKIHIIAENTDSFIQKAKTVVASDSASVEYIFKENGDNAKILDYLLYQTDYHLGTIDESFTGVYGYYRGEYLDGNRWDPYADGGEYYPKERPWYQAAKNENGEVAIASPYLDMDTGNIVISVTKLLSDKDSVFGMDVSLANIAENVKDYMKSNDFDYAYIIDNNGIIVASNDSSEIGFNYLDTDADKDTNNMAEVFRTALKGDETFEFAINNRKYLTISRTIENGWQVILLVDSDSVYAPLRYVAFIFAGVSICLVLALAYFLYNYLSERNKRLKTQAQEQKYLSELKDYTDQLSNYKRAILSDAIISLEVNLNNDELYYGAWKDAGGNSVPLEDILGISVPCSYDEYIKLWNQKFVNKNSKDSFNVRTDREHLIEAFNNGESEITFDYQASTIDGKETWLRRSICMIKNQLGDVIAYTSVKDVSSIVEASKREESYIRALSTDYDSIAVINFKENKKEDKIALHSYVSKNIIDIVGKDVLSEENFTKRLDKLAEHINPLDVNEFSKRTCREYIIETLNKGEIHNVDFRLMDKDNNIFYQERFIPLNDENGKLIGMLACLRNIDNEIRNELGLRSDLEKAKLDAESSNIAKTTFLFNMSHDIRTPMNAIIGFTEMAKKHIDDKEKVNECLGKVTSASEHLLSLINDVLDMSRVESGKVTIAEEPTCIGTTIDGIVSMMANDANVKNIKMTSFIDPDVSEKWVYIDRLRMARVLMNIVSNSIKYTEPGGSIDISTIELPSDKEGYAKCRYVIKDTGIGMTKEFLETIFEPFARAESSTKSGVIGTGLGMSITKSLVELMGGTIKIESALGQGTIVTLEFENRIAEPIKTDEIVDTNDIDDFEGKRILLVEDNEMNREIATEILEEVGFVIDTAEDGTIAVKKVRENGNAYDLVLMDIQMPIMNGYDATKTIREFNKDIPIIAMTANAFEEDKKNSLEAGMNDHIAKPIDVNVLKRALKKHLNK